MRLLTEQLLLLLGDILRRADGAFVVWVLDCCGLVGTLEGAHCVLFLSGERDDVAVPWHLEDVVAIMVHRHELG